MEHMRLDGMVTLVTGAGGGELGGIGAGCARCLAQRGSLVAVNDIDPAAAQATVAELQALGAQGWPIIGSVADPAQAKKLVEDTVAHFGRLDVLVNNAGIVGRSAIERMPDDEWLRVMAVNLNGPFFMSRAVLPVMRNQGFGRIINIASVAGIRISFLGGAAYTASKSGLLGLTRHLAAEVARYGITVNAIMPGITVTGLVQRSTTPETLAAIGRAVPAQTTAKPDDMGWLAAFLASREAGYLTGAAIPVDGAVTVLTGDFSTYLANSGKDVG